MNGRIPASSKGEVDDHVHGDQVGHSVVVGSHGAQDPLPGLKNPIRIQTKLPGGATEIIKALLTAMKTPLGPLKLSIQP